MMSVSEVGDGAESNIYKKSKKAVLKVGIFCYLVVGGAGWQYCDCVAPGNPCTSLSALPGYPCPHYLLNKY